MACDAPPLRFTTRRTSNIIRSTPPTMTICPQHAITRGATVVAAAAPTGPPPSVIRVGSPSRREHATPGGGEPILPIVPCRFPCRLTGTRQCLRRRCHEEGDRLRDRLGVRMTADPAVDPVANERRQVAARRHDRRRRR